MNIHKTTMVYNAAVGNRSQCVDEFSVFRQLSVIHRHEIFKIWLALDDLARAGVDDYPIQSNTYLAKHMCTTFAKH